MKVSCTNTQRSSCILTFVLAGALIGAVSSATLVGAIVQRAVRASMQEAADSTTCSRLYAVGWALDTYYTVHGHYPPAQIVDDDGTPIHSWRGILLPFIRDENMVYRLDEPWNGPNNALLKDRAPLLLGRPPDRSGNSDIAHEWTDVVALVGPHGLLQEVQQVTHLTKPREDIIKLVHIPDGLVAWLEPRDLPFRRPGTFGDEPSVHRPFAGLPEDPIVLFADNKYVRMRRDVDFAVLGDWTRDDLFDLGVIRPCLSSYERPSPAMQALLPFALALCIICFVATVVAYRALCKARAERASRGEGHSHHM